MADATRSLVGLVGLGLGLTFSASAAAAQPLDYVVVDPPRTRASGGAKVIYLNPCAAGCTVTAGDDSAAGDRSSILGRNGAPSTVTLEPFAWDQATWDGMVACVRARYEPWAVTVVTDEPSSGRYLEVMAAGLPSALALGPNTLGVAPLTNDCSPLPSAIAFAFANAHAARPEQVEELCTTVIHEAGHLYGLDHEFACKDPMTYLGGCGAKVFVNRSLACGELTGERPCQCGATQNSFIHLTDAIGPGQAPAAPEVRIDYPPEGAVVDARFSVFVAPVSPRPLTEVALWINGRAWVRAPGSATEDLYQLATPAEVPDGTLELEVRTRDDLGNVGVAARTVTKGAACVDASTCLPGQTCAGGGCRSPAGTVAIGGACTIDEDCVGKLCAVADGVGACTEPCYPLDGACGAGLSCRIVDDESFGCLPTVDEGGCCSTGGRPDGAGLIVLGALALRWRRRRPG
ncbi:MAG: hypothetical protein IPL61_18425 [Myxococcales bacterium]|nr:hypothetical protein [Myxococcales bacterium]